MGERPDSNDLAFQTGKLVLVLPAHHAAVRIARHRVRACAEAAGLAASELDRLEFVAGELLDNAVDHGGGKSAMDATQWGGQVHMHLWLDCQGQGWRLRVDDEGGGDPKDLEPFLVIGDDLPNLEDERGRGFFLLLGMLDSLKVEPSISGAGIGLIAEVLDAASK